MTKTYADGLTPITPADDLEARLVAALMAIQEGENQLAWFRSWEETCHEWKHSVHFGDCTRDAITCLRCTYESMVAEISGFRDILAAIEPDVLRDRAHLLRSISADLEGLIATQAPTEAIITRLRELASQAEADSLIFTPPAFDPPTPLHLSRGTLWQSLSGVKVQLINIARCADDCSVEMIYYTNVHPTKDFPAGEKWVLAKDSFLAKFRKIEPAELMERASS